MSYIVKLAALAFAAVVAASTNAVAQGGDQEVQVDCSAFQRQSDGRWVAIRTTTIKVGTNTITRSAGSVNCTINGLSCQDAITQKCANQGAPPRSERPVYANTNWKKTDQSVPECLQRGRELVRNYPHVNVVGETVFTTNDGYTFLIRCTPLKVILFAVVGPPDSTQERNDAADRRFDEVFGHW
jgi:hypothetical protein